MLVNITIPVFNEQAELPATISKLNCLVNAWSRHDYEIVVANNGSTDRTLDIAREFPNRATAEQPLVLRMEQLRTGGIGEPIQCVCLCGRGRRFERQLFRQCGISAGTLPLA